VNFGASVATFEAAIWPVLMLVSQVTFGAYTTLLKPYVQKYGPLFSNGVAFVVGGAACAPFVRNWHFEPSLGPIVAITHMTIVVTVFGYIFYFHGLRHVPVIVGTSIFFLKPIIGSALAVLLLGDMLKPSFFAGLVIVFCAVGIMIIGDYLDGRNSRVSSKTSGFLD